MLTRMAARQWPMSKKNGQIMIGHYLNTVGEPHSEIPHVPCLFLVGRVIITCFYFGRKRSQFYKDIPYLSLDIETSSVSLF